MTNLLPFDAPIRLLEESDIVREADFRKVNTINGQVARQPVEDHEVGRKASDLIGGLVYRDLPEIADVPTGPSDSERIAHLEQQVDILRKVITEALSPFRPVEVSLRVGGAAKRPWVILAAPAQRKLELIERNGHVPAEPSDS